MKRNFKIAVATVLAVTAIFACLREIDSVRSAAIRLSLFGLVAAAGFFLFGVVVGAIQGNGALRFAEYFFVLSAALWAIVGIDLLLSGSAGMYFMEAGFAAGLAAFWAFRWPGRHRSDDSNLP